MQLDQYIFPTQLLRPKAEESHPVKLGTMRSFASLRMTLVKDFATVLSGKRRLKSS